MRITFLNHRKHPDDESKRFFFYHDLKTYQEMQSILTEEKIFFEAYIDDAKVGYVIVHEDDYEKAQHPNAMALAKYKQKFIPDAYLRYFLIGLLLIALTFALIGYFKS